jgi:hypothetical protein
MNKNLKETVKDSLMNALKAPLKGDKPGPKRAETPVENRMKTRRELPEDIQLTVTLCAFGDYQARLLCNEMAWSGKDVGRPYANGYRTSRQNLLKRIQDKLPRGWAGRLALVKQEGDKRPRKQLVISNLFGDEYVW